MPCAGRERLFPGVSDAEWQDWRWQQRNAIRTLEALERLVPLTDDEREGCKRTASVFRLGISPYYLSLVDLEHPFCPVRMQAIPVRAEAGAHEGELRDPLGEDLHRPVRAIVHKYPDRVLLLALDHCSVYCRHCTRRRITGGAEGGITREELAEALAYLRDHREVRDVLVSGGDPLLLSTERLVELLVDHGVPVENQAVLMRRVNSSVRAIKDLMQKCLTMRVRPYYLHQMDVAEGLEHLRTPLSQGIAILQGLRGWTSGLAVPHLAVDLPGGGGKVTLQPDYVIERRGDRTLLRNFRGEPYAYPEPRETDCGVPYDEIFYGPPKRAARPRTSLRLARSHS